MQLLTRVLLLLSTALTQAQTTNQKPTYGKCNPTTFGRKSLVNQPLSLTKVLASSSIIATGSIVIIDGCTFEARNFTFSGGENPLWYGSFPNSVEGLSLSDTVVRTTLQPTTIRYSLKQVPGAEANFDGFDQFKLFDLGTQQVIAIANMPPRSTTPTATTAAGSTPTSTQTSGQLKTGASILLTLAAFLL